MEDGIGFGHQVNMKKDKNRDKNVVVSDTVRKQPLQRPSPK